MIRFVPLGLLVFSLLDSAPPSLHEPKSGSQEAPAALTGMVRDPDGKPVAGVEIIALGLSRVTFSDNRGTFRMERLPAGTYELHFRRLGWNLERRTVTLLSGTRLEVEVELRTVS